MAVPDKAEGYGNLDKQNVFKLTFSEDLSAAPIWEAYDNSETFPAVDSYGSTTAGKLFVGTTVNGDIAMICLVATTSASPGADWIPAGATGGSANPNRLEGTTSYVTDPTTPSSGEAILWNMVVELPSDLEPSDDMEHLLQVKYSYIGSTPALSWFYNDNTEGAPNWVGITRVTHGIRHSASGASGPNYYANIPFAGVEETVEGWITE